MTFSREVLDAAEELVGRARSAQDAVNELGAGPPGSRVPIVYHATGLTATLILEVAVVRSIRPRRCPVCKRKRVLYALTLTGAPVGNPDVQWRCAPDGGLR